MLNFQWPVSPRKLRELGVLGMNRRNADFLLLGNPRQHYPQVDNKLITKTLCLQSGVPVPATYAVIDSYAQLRDLSTLLANHREFVVKPAGGGAGRGLLVIANHDGEVFLRLPDTCLSLPEIRYHLSSILAGLYSMGGQQDVALIEERIQPHPVFIGISDTGTPDIRILIYRQRAVMAMLRLPTRESQGRANLHQGAVGVGVDLETGLTCGGVQKNQLINLHPDTGAPLAGLALPFWEQTMQAALTLSKQIHLDYLGVDLVLDIKRGPVVLEANARPGLALQLANRQGLLPRLLSLADTNSSGRSAGPANSILSGSCPEG